MARERRQFTKEFKIEAVRLVVEEKRPAAQVARELDIGRNLLRRWKNELHAGGAEAFPGNGRLTRQEEEIRRLKRELAQAGRTLRAAARHQLGPSAPGRR